MPSANTENVDYVKRAHALQSVAAARELYDEWASNYDKDLEAQEYTFPEFAAQALKDVLSLHESSAHGSGAILDAGCGTGLAAIQLAKLGVKHPIDGIDLSSGMLQVARRKGVYRDLHEADLSSPIAEEDGSYDAVICVGTLTKGHVGPQILREFTRIVRPEGYIVATILEEIWLSAGFKDEVDRLAVERKVEVVRSDLIGVVRSQTTGGRILVLHRT